MTNDSPTSGKELDWLAPWREDAAWTSAEVDLYRRFVKEAGRDLDEAFRKVGCYTMHLLVRRKYRDMGVAASLVMRLQLLKGTNDPGIVTALMLLATSFARNDDWIVARRLAGLGLDHIATVSDDDDRAEASTVLRDIIESSKTPQVTCSFH